MMDWLIFIGKIILTVFGIGVVLAVLLVVMLVIYLAYEQANGRNPFL